VEVVSMTQAKPTTFEVAMWYQLQRLERRQETDQELIILMERLPSSEIMEQFKHKRLERMERRLVEIVELRKRLEQWIDHETGMFGIHE
jgi:hypothetical protein